MAFRGQFKSGAAWSVAFRGQIWPRGVRILQFIWERWLAIRSALESGLPRGYFCFGKPQYLTAELSKWVNSIPDNLHQVFPCLMRHTYVADCLDLNYTPMVSVHTRFSWYYTFKLIKISTVKEMPPSKWWRSVFPDRSCKGAQYKRAGH
jgi:hypothetical protein